MERSTGVADPAEGARPRRSAALTWPVAVSAGAFAVFALVRAFGLERGFPAVPLLAYTPYVLAAALPVAVGAAVLRRWASAAVLALAVLVLAVAVVPRAVPHGITGTGGPQVRILTLNTLMGGVDPADLVVLVRERDVDVLALQEVTPALVEGLAAAGIGDVLPHVVDHSGTGVHGSSVHSVFSLTDLGDPGREIGAFHMARARAEVSGRTLEVVSVHPVPPVSPAAVRAWEEGLAAVAELPGPGAGVLGQAEGQDDPLKPDVRVLAGDFNATPDHARMREVLDMGYVSAARMAGDGLTGTWPADGFPPRVAIDHVLVREGMGVGAYEVLDVAGTDHRAVLAEVSLPEPR
ncbi:endonuclease/exonuclease/phosphatase family protein [Nocardiopsis sp. LOL_012]|uniref:endonuclease/exonuclease/phosphatase family protein n=1 Tax=Nocardiopsis sp. LOL_012 TaxID=3345409 RepID=UPI003A8A500C